MSGTPRVTSHIREEVKILQRLGFTYARHDSRSHPVFEHPQYGEVTLPSTPGRGGGWRHRLWCTLAQRMSVTVPELEALIAGQKTVGKRTVRRKTPGRKRPRPLQLVKPQVKPQVLQPPAPEPIPPVPEVASVTYLPTDPWTDARGEAAKQLQKANLAANARERLEAPFPWSTSRRSAA